MHYLEKIIYTVILLDNKWQLFDELSESSTNVSVLSDPFSGDDGEASNPIPNADDWNIFRSYNFSPAFYSAISATDANVISSKEEIKTMMAEAPDQIRMKNVFTQVKRRVPLMTQIKIVNLLNDKNVSFGEEDVTDSFIPDEKKTWEDLKDEVFGSRNIMKNIRSMTEKERSRKIIKEQSDKEAYETMSGYWRILRDYQDFHISHPNYNAYCDNSKCYWLQTESVNDAVLETSCIKVLNWFSKHFQ